MGAVEKKKFLFITSANLTTNPRTLKEIKLALSKGFEVDFAGFRLGGWSDENDDKVRRELPLLHCIYFDATRSSLLVWFFDSVLERFARVLWRLAPRSLFVSALAHSKRTMRMLSFLKQVKKGDYDFVIGHTLAAFYPAYKIARKAGAKLGLDVEDYHPGERIEPLIKNEKERREELMKGLLPKADYITSASDLITIEVNNLAGGIALKNHSILNYFSKTEFSNPVTDNDVKLKLVWFSQNINYGRGLETLLSVWDKLHDAFSLTLIGKLDDNFHKKYLKQYPDILIRPAMKQADLHNALGNYDIGLALEDTNADYNRNICLTNKILAYYQAGLYILATDTEAQKKFISLNAGHGEIIGQRPEAILAALNNIHKSKAAIKSKAPHRFWQAQAYCWENEATKVFAIWKDALAQPVNQILPAVNASA